MTINSNPDWAATYPQGPIDLVDLSEFEEFMGELVERYDGDNYRDAPGSPVVDYWELYNEPDGIIAGLPRRVTEDIGVCMVTNMQKCYVRCIRWSKPLRPMLRCCLGALPMTCLLMRVARLYRQFIDDVLIHNGGACFDYMNFHYYPAFETNLECLRQRTRWQS